MGNIAGMAEVVGAFGGTEGVEELTDGAPEEVDASGHGGLSRAFSLANACAIGFRSGL
jgi:hypothetical protein